MKTFFAPITEIFSGKPYGNTQSPPQPALQTAEEKFEKLKNAAEKGKKIYEDVLTDDQKATVAETVKEVVEIVLPGLLSLGERVPVFGQVAGVLMEFYESYQRVQGNKDHWQELVKKVTKASAFISQYVEVLDKKIDATVAGHELATDALTELWEAVKTGGEIAKKLSKRLSFVAFMTSTQDTKKLTLACQKIDQALDHFSGSISAVFGAAIHDTVGDVKIYVSEMDKKIDCLLPTQEDEILKALGLDLTFAKNQYDRHLKFFCPGTREWLLREVDTWLDLTSNNTADKLFWLQAGAGMGKSVFTAKICQKLKAENCLLGEVFFDYYDPSFSDPVIVLKRLIFQTVVEFPALFDWFLEYLRSNSKNDFKSLFEDVFVKLLKQLEAQQLVDISLSQVIVIDALDESGTVDSLQRKTILTLFSISNMRLLPTWVKVFVTGRPENDIMTALVSYSHVIEESNENHIKDLEFYLRSSVEEVQDSLRFDATFDLDLCVRILMVKSEGVFIYLAMVTNFLKETMLKHATDHSFGFTHVEFLELLVQLPTGLDYTYQKSIEKLYVTNQKEIVVRFLQIMLVAQEALSEKTVQIILSLDSPGGTERWEKLRDSVKTLFPLRSSGDKQYFYPFHKSICDWLLNQNTNEAYRVNRDTAHCELACFLVNSSCINVTYRRGLSGTTIVSGVDEFLQVNFYDPAAIESNGKNHQAMVMANIEQDELKCYGIRYLSYHIMQCATSGNMWHNLVHYLWTNLQWIQVSLALFGPVVLVREIKKLNEMIQQQTLRNDLKSILWLMKFLALMKPKVGWFTEVSVQLNMRFRSYEGNQVNRLNRLRINATHYVRAMKSWQYVKGPVATPRSALQARHSNFKDSIIGMFATVNKLVIIKTSAVVIYDMENGTYDHEFEGHSNISSFFQLSDGSLATRSSDKTIYIWNLADRTCENVLRRHSEWITLLCPLRDNHLASGSQDRIIRIWNVSDWKCSKVLRGHDKGINSLCQLADDRLASGSDDKTIRIWNLSNGKCEIVLNEHSSGIQSLCQLFDGRLIATSEKAIYIWNLCDRKREKKFENPDQVSILYPLSHGRIAIGTLGRNTIHIWNILDGTCEKVLNGDCCVLFELPDGRLVSGTLTGFINIWNISDGNCEKVLKGHDSPIKCLFQLDGLLASCCSNAICIWDVSDWTCEEAVDGHTKAIKQCVKLSDGRLASYSDDLTIRIWNISDGTCEKVLNEHSADITSLCQLPGGRLASGSCDKTLRIWSVSDGTCEKVLRLYSWVCSLCQLSRSRLACGYEDGVIQIWGVSDFNREKKLIGHSANITSLCKLEKGRLASGSNDKTICIWKISNGKCGRVLKGHSERIPLLCQLSGGRLASGSDDKTIRIWNLSNGKCEKVLRGHSDRVTSLCTLWDGRVASSSWDNTVRIWNVSDGSCENKFDGIRYEMQNDSPISELKYNQMGMELFCFEATFSCYFFKCGVLSHDMNMLFLSLPDETS